MRRTILLALTLLALPLPARAAVTELTIWEEEQHPIQVVLDEALARFHKAHPEIAVKRSHFNTEDLRVQFQMGAMAKSGADLVLAPNDFAGVFSTMGIVQPVEGWARMERFEDSSVKAISHAGHAWGVPLNRGNHLILFMNKALIPDVPQTLDELVAKAKAVTDQKARRYGLAYNALEPFWLVPFLGAFGETPLVDAKPNLANAGTVKALEFVRDLKFKHRVTPEDCSYACAETLFAEKKAAMTINGDWAIGKFSDALGKDLVIAPLPRNAQGDWMRPMVSGKFLMLRQGLAGAKLAAVKALVEFMVAPETQKFLATESKRLSARKDLADFHAQNPVLKASLAAMAHAQPMPLEVEMRAVWDAIRPQLAEVMAGRRDPKDAADTMQKEAELRIKEMAH